MYTYMFRNPSSRYGVTYSLAGFGNTSQMYTRGQLPCVPLFNDDRKCVVTKNPAPPAPCLHMAYNNKFLTKSKLMYPCAQAGPSENGIKLFESF